MKTRGAQRVAALDRARRWRRRLNGRGPRERAGGAQGHAQDTAQSEPGTTGLNTRTGRDCNG